MRLRVRLVVSIERLGIHWERDRAADLQATIIVILLIKHL